MVYLPDSSRGGCKHIVCMCIYIYIYMNASSLGDRPHKEGLHICTLYACSLLVRSLGNETSYMSKFICALFDMRIFQGGCHRLSGHESGPITEMCINRWEFRSSVQKNRIAAWLNMYMYMYMCMYMFFFPRSADSTTPGMINYLIVQGRPSRTTPLAG